jgi:hypothetical protein
MRAFDWDPIRAEHYGQRPHRPHKQVCGRRRIGKNFLTLLQHWSGAVMVAKW